MNLAILKARLWESRPGTWKAVGESWRIFVGAWAVLIHVQGKGWPMMNTEAHLK